MKKLKNWIIKKLGGYTKEEFRAITDVHYKFFFHRIIETS